MVDSALKLDIESWLSQLPKIELHCHLEGTATPRTLYELSNRSQTTSLSLEESFNLKKYSKLLNIIP